MEIQIAAIGGEEALIHPGAAWHSQSLVENPLVSMPFETARTDAGYHYTSGVKDSH